MSEIAIYHQLRYFVGYEDFGFHGWCFNVG